MRAARSGTACGGQRGESDEQTAARPDEIGQALGAGQGIGPSGADADEGTAPDPELGRELADVVGQVEHRPSRAGVRAAEPGPLNADPAEAEPVDRLGEDGRGAQWERRSHRGGRGSGTRRRPPAAAKANARPPVRRMLPTAKGASIIAPARMPARAVGTSRRSSRRASSAPAKASGRSIITMWPAAGTSLTSGIRTVGEDLLRSARGDDPVLGAPEEAERGGDQAEQGTQVGGGHRGQGLAHAGRPPRGADHRPGIGRGDQGPVDRPGGQEQAPAPGRVGDRGGEAAQGDQGCAGRGERAAAAIPGIGRRPAGATRTRRRTASGRWAARTRAIAPPIEWPTRSKGRTRPASARPPTTRAATARRSKPRPAGGEAPNPGASIRMTRRRRRGSAPRAARSGASSPGRGRGPGARRRPTPRARAEAGGTAQTLPEGTAGSRRRSTTTRIARCGHAGFCSCAGARCWPGAATRARPRPTCRWPCVRPPSRAGLRERRRERARADRLAGAAGEPAPGRRRPLGAGLGGRVALPADAGAAPARRPSCARRSAGSWRVVRARDATFRRRAPGWSRSPTGGRSSCAGSRRSTASAGRSARPTSTPTGPRSWSTPTPRRRSSAGRPRGLPPAPARAAPEARRRRDAAPGV